MAFRRKKIRRIVMRGAAAQFEGEMVKPGFWRTDDVEDVVIVIAGQERRNSSNQSVVRNPMAEQNLHEFVGLRRDQRDMPKTRWNDARGCGSRGQAWPSPVTWVKRVPRNDDLH